MSRIGRLPIPVPSGATVTVKGQTIEAKGPKGAQTLVVSDLITPELNDNELVLKPRADLHKAAEEKIADIKAKGKKMITYAQALDGSARAQWGTSRARAEPSRACAYVIIFLPLALISAIFSSAALCRSARGFSTSSLSLSSGVIRSDTTRV